MTKIDEFRYLFVIDTDMYSGNFERPMCAFMTGQFGDCGVGQEEADIFEKEVPDADMFELIDQQPDDHGCMRPATIWTTPNWMNDGFGFHYQAGDEKKAKAHHRREEKKHGMKSAPFQPCPAYQSVGIWMRERPTEADIKLLKKRARLFVKRKLPKSMDKYNRPGKIDGFRLVTMKTTESEEKL